MPNQIDFAGRAGIITGGRLVEAAGIASLVAWLSPPECSFTTAGVFDIPRGASTY